MSEHLGPSKFIKVKRRHWKNVTARARRYAKSKSRSDRELNLTLYVKGQPMHLTPGQILLAVGFADGARFMAKEIGRIVFPYVKGCKTCETDIIREVAALLKNKERMR